MDAETSLLQPADLSAALRAEVVALARPEGRVVGSPGHTAARLHLGRRLRELGLSPYQVPAGGPVPAAALPPAASPLSGKVPGVAGLPRSPFELPYRHDGVEFCNLVALLPGRDRRARPLLLGAHYDSALPAACADDNAAAVAVVLAVVDQLQRRAAGPAGPLPRDLLVAFFDAEEPPYFLTDAMGSTRFVLDQMDRRGVHLAVIQDLTGHDVELPLPAGFPGATALATALHSNRVRDLLFLMGAESHPRLPELIGRCPRPPRLPLLAAPNRNVGDLSDHHVFRRFGLPYLFFSCGHWPHYHSVTDTPDRLNYEKMSRIVAFLTQLSVVVAENELPGPVAEPESDTVAWEIGLWKAALGDGLLSIFQRAMGLPERLVTREDLDALVERITLAGL